MNTFTKDTLPSKIDTGFLNTLETYNMIDNLDDLFEAYLGYILHMGQVWQTEILLFNSMNTLTPVAESKRIGPPHRREPKVYSEIWLLDYPVKHTVKFACRLVIRRPGKRYTF